MIQIERFLVAGAAEPTTLIAGHSHIVAYVGASSSGNEVRNERQYGVVYAQDPDLWPKISDSYWKFILQHPASEVCVCWNGNQHNALFLIETEPAISVPGGREIFQSKNDRTKPRTLVSYSTIDELWAPDFEELRRVLSILGTSKRVMLLGTPPPKSRSEISAQLKTDEYFAARFELTPDSSFEDLISPDHLRILLWKRIQETLEKVAFEIGCPFLAVPPSCFVENFLLRSELSAPDASHANTLFASKMIEAIEHTWGEQRA